MWRDERALEVYFADPVPYKHRVRGHHEDRQCPRCTMTGIFPLTSTSGLPVWAHCPCGHRFPMHKQEQATMSKSAVAQKAATKIDQVARELMTEAAQEGSDVLAHAEVVKVVAKCADFLRGFKDAPSEEQTRSDFESFTGLKHRKG